MEVEAVREDIAKRVRALGVEPERLFDVRDIAVAYSGGTFSIRVYRPVPKEALPAVLYIHGGGWAAGSVETHDNICRYLSKKCESLVVSVDYRQPPEHKYPASFNDCRAAFGWLQEYSKELGIDTGRLALAGDSAGGNLVASLCLKMREENRLDGVVIQVLVNPSLDLTPGSVSYRTYPFFVEWYLNDVCVESGDKRVSPLLASDLRGLPRAFIVTCGRDEIREDGENYRRKLEEAGVEVELMNLPDMGHLGVLWAGADPSAMPVMGQVASRLRLFLGLIDDPGLKSHSKIEKRLVSNL